LELGLRWYSPGLPGRYCRASGSGRLPGDIMIQRGSTSFYFPPVTCIVISVVLSALMWLLNR
jgi:hypothetical protein